MMTVSVQLSKTGAIGNLCQTPHGRHMLAAMLALNAEFPRNKPEALFENIPSSDILPILKDVDTHESSGTLLARGWLSEKQLLDVASGFKEVKSRTSEIAGIGLDDLASPVLSSESVLELSGQLADYRPTIRHIASCALRANPNAKGYFPGLPFIPEYAGSTVGGWEHYVRALAKHGDLSDKNTLGYLQKHLIDPIVGMKGEGHFAVPRGEGLAVLSARKGFPADMVRGLCEIGLAGVVGALMKGDVHQNMVKKGLISYHSLTSVRVSSSWRRS